MPLGEQAAIAVLGTASPGLVDATADAARQLGKNLAEAGYALAVLGADGVAAAAAGGAGEAGGDVLAVVPKGDEPAYQAAHTVDATDALAGIRVVLDAADAIVVVEADLASLALALQVWAYGLTPAAPYRQIVFVGAHWQETIAAVAAAANLDARTRAMVSFAEDPGEIVDILRFYVAPSD